MSLARLPFSFNVNGDIDNTGGERKLFLYTKLSVKCYIGNIAIKLPGPNCATRQQHELLSW